MYTRSTREMVVRYPHGPRSKLPLGTAPHLTQRASRLQGPGLSKTGPELSKTGTKLSKMRLILVNSGQFWSILVYFWSILGQFWSILSQTAVYILLGTTNPSLRSGLSVF